MNSRWPWIVAVLILLLLLPVVFVAGVYVGTVVERWQPAPPVSAPSRPFVVPVPLASSNLPMNRKICKSDIALVEMTVDQLSQSGLDARTIMIEPTQIIGRTLNAPLQSGDYFTTHKLYLEGEEPAEAEASTPPEEKPATASAQE